MSLKLPAIPIIDIRDGGPLDHARQHAVQARALRDACLAFFPAVAKPLVPALDWASRRWLGRSRSPYVDEIARIAAELNFSGIWLLNASYQWGCTARAVEQDGAPWLMRTLDWPFKGLGRHTAVARMRGTGGDFFSVTWPGYVGALTAMAPGRFAASINQAPMWRRMRHRWLRPYDFVVNVLKIWQRTDLMPPDQLLRQTFETCEDYSAARHMLETTPVARPVIFTLIGCGGNERCVIERTETGFVLRPMQGARVCAANHFVGREQGWRARPIDSAGRLACAVGLGGAQEDFSWFTPPIANVNSRLAMNACAANGALSVIGTGGVAPATEIFRFG